MAIAHVAIVWQTAPGPGQIEILNGRLIEATIDQNGVAASLDAGRFNATHPARLRLQMEVDNDAAAATVVHVRTARHPFTFLAHDVCSKSPILIPEYAVAVTTADDARSFEEIHRSIRSRELKSNLARIEAEPEESYESAAAATREMKSPIWQGISRDVRIFEFNLRTPMQVTDNVQPRYHAYGYFWPEPEKHLLPARYGFVVGRGWGCTEEVSRRLDEGTLPIMLVERTDDDIRYDMSAFATLERSTLAPDNVRGTHPLVADGLCACHALTEAQQKTFESLRDAEVLRDEETVWCCRIAATNTAAVPRYAYFKALHPIGGLFGMPLEFRHDGPTGFGRGKDSDLVYGISKLNGRAMAKHEMAVLVQPGQTCTCDFLVPHRPIPADRAAKLAMRDTRKMLAECRDFWKTKLSAAAKFRLPEPLIENAIKAGILHIDLISYGHEPDGALNGTDGAYSALGSETTINIQFFDSMGLHDLARRQLNYFFEKQLDSGLMQNFVGYMLETGAVLWCVTEHWRYTRDDAWIRQVKPKILKAVDFLLNWRSENKREDLRGKGYGLLPGRVADPLDEQRIFMLNGYTYLGLSRTAELLANIDPPQSKRIAAEAAALREDIRTAFLAELGRGPVIPMADGTWCPTAGPWVGAVGPTALLLDNDARWSHGAFGVRDDLLGPMHLVFQEVLAPDEQATDFLLRFHSELLYSRNWAFSQPYYSRHPWVHLRRRETSAFLKGWYTGIASLADREIFSWWEHYFHDSPHKTHEEGEFMMQARWMLWLEEGDQLSLLRGVPRAWLENGKQIELDRVVSYFGPFSLKVSSDLSRNIITAKIVCDSDRKPRRVELRLPHPSGARAIRAEGGAYEPDTETVRIDNFNGSAEVRLHFKP